MIFWPIFDLQFPLIPRGKVCHSTRENVMKGLTFFIVAIDNNVAFFLQGFNERRGVGVEMIDPFATEKRKKSVSLKRNLSGHFSKVLDLQWCKHPHKSR